MCFCPKNCHLRPYLTQTLNVLYIISILSCGVAIRNSIRCRCHAVNRIKNYIDKYRQKPKPAYRHRLFINQRGRELTRHGIYRLCKKYLNMALPQKRLKTLSPVHSFRHSCAVSMLSSGCSLSDIRIQLGHEDLQATMVYLQLDLTHRRKVQKKFIEFNRSVLIDHPEIEALFNTQNKDDIMAWLDSL